MAAPATLPAKKRRHDKNLSLQQHLCETEMAAQALFGPGSRWAEGFVRFFKIANYQVFLLNLRVACLFHDIGKANEDFVRAMHSLSFEQQTIRHEHLSALLLHLPLVAQWLDENSEIDRDAITAAVLSHHLKASPPATGEYPWGSPRSEKSWLATYLNHPEVRRSLDRVAEVASLNDPPCLPAQDLSYRDGALNQPWLTALETGDRAGTKARRAYRRDPSRRSLMLAVKAGLVAADSVASGLFRIGQDINTWVEAVVGSAITAEQLESSIIRPRLDSIVKGATLKDFQREVAKQGPRTLLLAACGSGKTLAAWAWAREQCRHTKLGRVIFLYPTRGTATEGFRDYAGWAPEGEADLMHGSASYELEDMATNPSEALAGKEIGLTEAKERLFALGHWDKRYFSATADQFLSFLENRYSGLCMVPVLADAALVIDEVHSYDANMFRSLLSFLNTFGGPVLCMTATLPVERMEQLQDCGLRVFPNPDGNSSILAELAAAEDAPRYQVNPLAEAGAAVAIAAAAHTEGKRVLYVVNTVRRCQETALSLRSATGADVLVYHSRFRLVDRKRAHQQTVAAFQQSERAAIAVTTQVCEMSLDLDADVLITEHAPVTSLVQRFGRANRHLKRDFAVIHTYRPEHDLPYRRVDLQVAEAFLANLYGRCVSQKELARRLVEHTGKEAKSDTYSSFVDSGYYAVPGDFREGNDISETAILDDDLSEVLRLHGSRMPWDAYLLPIPRKKGLTQDAPSALPRFVRIAPAEKYCPTLGFTLEEIA